MAKKKSKRKKKHQVERSARRKFLKESLMERIKRLSLKKAAVWVKLPLPDPQVLKQDHTDVIKHEYLEKCEKIARMEAEVLVRIANKRFSMIWRLAVILAALICLILGLALGNKLGISYDKVKFETSPSKKTSAPLNK